MITGQSGEELERTRAIQVVDGTFGFGLLAWLVPEEGSWIRTGRDGEFDMDRDLEQPTFEVTAAGYHPKRVRAGEELGERVELEPRSSCGVHVFSPLSGPVRSASVTWRPAGRRGGPPAPDVSVTTETGGDGSTSIAAASDCHATVAVEGHGPRTVHVPVGHTVDVRLSEATAVLTLVCGETEQPVEGVRVLLTRLSDRNDVTRTSVSDEAGRIVLAGSDEPLEVELLGGAYWLHDRLSEGWSARNKIQATYVNDLQASDGGPQELRLHLACDTIDVRLVDADTGSLIRGSVRYGYTTPEIERHGWIYDLVGTQECRDGVLHVRALRLDGPRIDEQRGPGHELVVWPEGYQLENLGLLTSLGQGEAAVNEGRFAPAKKRALHVHDAAGRPVSCELWIRSDEGNIEYHDAIGTEEGVYGPFDWWGGGLIVFRPRPNPGGGGFSGGAGFEEVATVSAEQLADSEQVSLELDVPVSEVRVVGVDGRESRVIVVDRAGVEHDPASRSEDEIVFHDVPAGPVYVGPPAWARQLYFRKDFGLGRDSMEAPEGETLVVPFDAEWETADGVRGRIRVVGKELKELFLVPVYCTTSVRVPMGRSRPWWPLREDGTYSIARGEPLPKALVVCSMVSGRGHIAASTRSGSFVVLDVIEPGGDAELHASTVELVWEGPDRDGPTTVDWSFTGGSYTHPDGSVLTRYTPAWGKLHWSDTQPRRFGPFPEGELEIGRARGGVRWKTVTLTGDEPTVVPVGP